MGREGRNHWHFLNRQIFPSRVELGRRNLFPTRVVRVRKKVVRIDVAAVSEDLVKSSSASASASAAFVIPMSGDIVKFKVKVVVTIRQKKKDFKERIAEQLDAMADMIGWNVVLQLVSMEIDPKTKGPKKSNEVVLRDWSKKTKVNAERIHYNVEFTVRADFGFPRAITVTNKHE